LERPVQLEHQAAFDETAIGAEHYDFFVDLSLLLLSSSRILLPGNP
jgi:hypothetical protein